MKFVLDKVTKNGPRLGTISDLVTGRSSPSAVFKTPMLMQYTKAGSVPYISNDVLVTRLTSEPQSLQVSLANMLQFNDIFMDENSGVESVCHFVGLPDCPAFLIAHDVLDLRCDGFERRNEIAIWTRCGKRTLNAKQYMRLVESYKPTFFATLSDSDTNMDSSGKRIEKCLQRTIQLFDECVDIVRNDRVKFANSHILASIEGGFSLNARRACISAMVREPLVQGFIVNGLYDNRQTNFAEILQVANFIAENLPENKLRVVPCAWSPPAILRLIEHGYDIFDTSYAIAATERKAALTFAFAFEHAIAIDNLPEINLNDYDRFIGDFGPLKRGCDCHTCRNHTRAYLTHLFHCNELSAHILLNIHNIYQYLMYFAKIRESIAVDRFDHLKHLIENQHRESTVCNGIRHTEVLIKPKPI